MYVIIAPIQIKEGKKDEFVQEMILDAKGSIENEPGCLTFDIIQDPDEPNRIWLYEVYKDEVAFKIHSETPHFTKWRDAVKDWFDECPTKTVIGGSKIYP